MSRQEATEEYSHALKLGQKEFKDRQARGRDPYPAVLDEILGTSATDTSIYIGLVEIPTERIVGTRSAGRITAFTASFLPLLAPDSEFAIKWIQLCQAHLSEEGIRDPIECFEYLGNFYVQEGNKRVSVLKYYGAARIPGIVRRIMPAQTDTPREKAYLEFIEFYKLTGIYDIQFTAPGGYAKLTAAAGFAPGQEWPEADRKRLRAYFQYFREAFLSLGGGSLYIQAEDALLLWLKLYPYQDLGNLNAADLKKSLSSMWDNIVAISDPDPVVKTEPPEAKSNILNKIIRPDHLNVAFVHQRTPQVSPWCESHEAGRQHLEEVMGKSVTTRVYFNANNPEKADQILEQAVADGADIVFTTAPQLIASSLKASVHYPKVRFLNCSVHMPYPTVRTYYSRIYEGKFITGAIAGAMSRDGQIGYVGSYPIHGVPASINAFALGALMTNPDATIHLKWSCLPGNPTQEFLDAGIRVISNRDAPTRERPYHEYGTYMANDENILVPLASPRWVWGKFYEGVVQAILSGTWQEKKSSQAVNHWWGMKSGVIDVTVSDSLPEGVRTLAMILRKGLQDGSIDPFAREITAQDGSVKNDGTRIFTADDVLHMDWLCKNVKGSIPHFNDLLPYSQPMVRLLGLFSEQIPTEEVTP